MMAALQNARHELFAQELVKGKTGDEAYQLAGYHENRCNASRLKANESITARMAELQALGAERAIVSIASIAAQLDEDRQLAHDIKQAGAAVSASLGKAKLYGLLAEKLEHAGPGGGPIQTEHSDRDIAKAVLAVLGAGVKAG